ncbi:MAG: hypothetical protein HY865_21995 [Chloroflexi bacterium]|nr:hypothetical protein [Chloroflexota bacterium]
MMKVHEIPIEEGAAWDELVGSSPQGNIFLTHDLQSVWCETDPALQLVRLGCFDGNGMLVAGQPIFFKKKFGLRIPFIPRIFYATSPVLSSTIQQDRERQYLALSVLARASQSHFPFIKIEAHPNLMDVRPYLEQGWRARPKYIHIWNISDPEAILKDMHHNRRSYVRKAQNQFLFGHETGGQIVADFLHLYRESVRKFGWRPEGNWMTALGRRIEWMQARDIVRLYTCRTKDWKLVEAVVCVLSRLNQTVYFLLIGYDHSFDREELQPAIYWHAAQDLSNDFSFADFGQTSTPKIHLAKDLLGTASVPTWRLEAPYAHYMNDYYNKLRELKYALTSRLP